MISTNTHYLTIMHLFVKYRRSSEIDKTFISLELSALKTLFLNYLYLFELS